MEKDNYKTKVIFRKFKEGDIIALFPENVGGSQYASMSSYMHIGQHSGADRFLVYRTKPATPEEYEDLYQELESIGYDLEIRKKITYAMDKIRMRDYRSKVECGIIGLD